MNGPDLAGSVGVTRGSGEIREQRRRSLLGKIEASPLRTPIGFLGGLASYFYLVVLFTGAFARRTKPGTCPLRAPDIHDFELLSWRLFRWVREARLRQGLTNDGVQPLFHEALPIGF